MNVLSAHTWKFRAVLLVVLPLVGTAAICQDVCRPLKCANDDYTCFRRELEKSEQCIALTSKMQDEAERRRIMDIQAALKRAGDDPGPIDGQWGRQTKTALIHFQSSHGLATDGVPGPQTMAALGEYMGIKMPSKQEPIVQAPVFILKQPTPTTVPLRVRKPRNQQ